MTWAGRCGWAYVLPTRFDDTQLPGLLPDVSYVDLRGRSPGQFAAMIAAKRAGTASAVGRSSVRAGGSGAGGDRRPGPADRRRH